MECSPRSRKQTGWPNPYMHRLLRVEPNYKKNAHSLPWIDESFSFFDGSIVFASLDALSGCLQIPLGDDAKLKTAFSPRYGLYQWNVLFAFPTLPNLPTPPQQDLRSVY
jgi:hypothetical protein